MEGITISDDFLTGLGGYSILWENSRSISKWSPIAKLGHPPSAGAPEGQFFPPYLMCFYSVNNLLTLCIDQLD